MPQIDMPLEKLREYGGTNPRPSDFDSYWDRGLAEMNAIDPHTELIPAAFKSNAADCFDMYFTGTKGARVYAKLARPKGINGTCPAILFFHGYSGASLNWVDCLSWVGSGFVVAALDVRGQAGKSEDRGGVRGNTLRGHIIRGLDDCPDNLLFRDIFLDTAMLARVVGDMPEVDAQRIGAQGGSQGGGLTIACAALADIKRLAPVHPFLSDYKRVWNMDLFKNAYEELNAYFRMFDPLHEREDDIFNTLGYIDIQHLASRIKGETLLGLGLMDITCPPSTVFAAYNKINAPKEVRIYPDFRHEALPRFSEMAYEFMQGL